MDDRELFDMAMDLIERLTDMEDVINLLNAVNPQLLMDFIKFLELFVHEMNLRERTL